MKIEHVAWQVPDPVALADWYVEHLGMRARLIAAGATPAGEIVVTPAGDELAMLRDPWGIPLQLVRRAEPMIG